MIDERQARGAGSNMWARTLTRRRAGGQRGMGDGEEREAACAEAATEQLDECAGLALIRQCRASSAISDFPDHRVRHRSPSSLHCAPALEKFKL